MTYFLRFVAALLLVMVAAIITFVTGRHTLAVIIGGFGTQVVVFGTFAWVLLVDSKRRWPDADLGLRAYALLTFKSDPYGP